MAEPQTIPVKVLVSTSLGRSTSRHRTLCRRRGHRAGWRAWLARRTAATAWQKVVEPWCPRCERPVAFVIAETTEYVAMMQCGEGADFTIGSSAEEPSK